ncbi:hypothetical protein BDZ89DRAFT_1128899 [Hymenopellis radicata]|nr:hypothetical protein BDZ89DRAFT_1128899 [Hymenopellis radicata]
MNISWLLVRQPLRVGNQIRGKPSVRVRLGLVDARTHHVAASSGHGGACAPPLLSVIPPPAAPTKALQPEGAKIGNSLAVLANEPPNVDNAQDPVQAIQAVEASMERFEVNSNTNRAKLLGALNDLRDEINTQTAVLCGAFDAVIDDIRLIHVRNVNRHTSSDASIYYPTPYAGGGPLPRTPAEARNLSGNP